MPRGSKAQLEAFAQALAAGQSPEEAAKTAKYPKGTSFASNARKRAQREDVKARIAELQAPALEKLKERIEISVAWETDQHLQIINAAKAVPGEVTVLEWQRSLEALAKLHGLNAADKHEFANKGPLFDVAKLSADELNTLERLLAAASVADGQSGED